MDRRRLAIAGTAVAAVSAIAVGVAVELGAFTPAPKRTSKSKSKPKDEYDLPAPPPDDLPDVGPGGPLEDWEIEALEGGPTDPGYSDDPVGPHEFAVGSGHPSDWLPGVLDNPTKTKPYQVVDPLEDERFAPEYRGAPFAASPYDTAWPVATRSSARLVTSYRAKDGFHGYSGRAFGAKRASDEGVQMEHAGVDLFAREADVVSAPEDGQILAVLPFHHGSWSVYLLTEDRRVLNLGEVEKFSWREFDVRPGDDVTLGQPLARVARQKHGSTMIHFEIYDATAATDDEILGRIRSGGFQWLEGDPAPEGLLDPTAYLLTTAARTYQREHEAKAS